MAAGGTKVSSTVTLDEGVLRSLDRAQKQAFEQSGDATLTELRNRQTMPFDTGEMQNSDTTVDASKANSGTVSIVTTAPQARRLYFHPEYNFRRSHNAKAGGKWFDEFLNDGFIAKAFAARLKQLGGL